MVTLQHYYKLEMAKYQINSGSITNLLEQNIMIRKMMNFIIIQFKTSQNKIILKFQKSGNMKFQMKMKTLRL